MHETPSNEDRKPCCGEESIPVINEQPCCNSQRTELIHFPLYNPEVGPVDAEETTFTSGHAPHWIKGFVETASGRFALIETTMAPRDTLGTWKARWGISRMDYRVPPGLYGVGTPSGMSPVFVTANYKMSFDMLRRELSSLDAWVMVIDTLGINVWCAAGKGTFGTEEIIKRIGTTGLSRVVSHRTLILPQLGAPGVAAHEVRTRSGFKVIYGPVRACDIKAFLNGGMKATGKMRVVEFPFTNRLCLTPIELVGTLKPLALIAVAVFIAHLTGLITASFSNIYPFIGAIIVGAVLTPTLLPWIPVRAFSAKGWLTGVLWTLAVLYLKGGTAEQYGAFGSAALLLILPAISAFLALNFTGASTYTSLSGVKREMKFAVPAMIISALAGTALWLVGLFTGN